MEEFSYYRSLYGFPHFFSLLPQSFFCLLVTSPLLVVRLYVYV